MSPSEGPSHSRTEGRQIEWEQDCRTMPSFFPQRGTVLAPQDAQNVFGHGAARAPPPSVALQVQWGVDFPPPPPNHLYPWPYPWHSLPVPPQLSQADSPFSRLAPQH